MEARDGAGCFRERRRGPRPGRRGRRRRLPRRGGQARVRRFIMHSEHNFAKRGLQPRSKCPIFLKSFDLWSGKVLIFWKGARACVDRDRCSFLDVDLAR